MILVHIITEANISSFRIRPVAHHYTNQFAANVQMTTNVKMCHFLFCCLFFSLCLPFLWSTDRPPCPLLYCNLSLCPCPAQYFCQIMLRSVTHSPGRTVHIIVARLFTRTEGPSHATTAFVSLFWLSCKLHNHLQDHITSYCVCLICMPNVCPLSRLMFSNDNELCWPEAKLNKGPWESKRTKMTK